MIVECPSCHSRYDVSGRPPGTKARCRCGTVFELPVLGREAASLSCPRCGANVSSQCKQCEFCDAALLLKACPRCFARIFHGAKHCNDCGAEVEVPAIAGPDGNARVLPCPRCDGQVLEARLLGNILMDECQSCHGIWLDRGAVERVIAASERPSVADALGIGRPASRTPGESADFARMYLRCPECDTVMNRVNFARRSGIIIDSCRGHGTWFDHRELPRVVEFVSQGGLSQRETRVRYTHEEDLASRSRQRPTVLTRETSSASVLGSVLSTVCWILFE
jgi:Zn-finger nucleic acid-binding protein